ncbi:hypothetical protein [Reinekea thalattae]|uniref:Uncharacterized protein n=1 Tax=Reinekea thalattae TaxID=2593301 RepID=A0A5C8Z753_9GAMM|nr:hypothetical protein [Reinekea thalattae]TXR53782.1 hypothetical protein FME95_04270 [Reinekea thalattae]
MKIPASINAYQSVAASGRRNSAPLTDDSAGQSGGFAQTVDSATEEAAASSQSTNVDLQSATSQAQALYSVNSSAQTESGNHQYYPEHPVQRASGGNAQAAVNQYLSVAAEDADSLSAQNPSLFGVDTYV